jgi:Uma2 family endonuclease
MTVEQFRELPLDDGPWTHELHYGEVIAAPRPRSRHYKLQVRLASLLRQRAAHQGIV